MFDIDQGIHLGNSNRFFTRSQCLATCAQPTTRKIIETTTKKTTTTKSLKRKYIIKTKSSCTKPRVSIYLIYQYSIATYILVHTYLGNQVVSKLYPTIVSHMIIFMPILF